MQTEIISHVGKAEAVVLTAAASPGDIILTGDSSCSKLCAVVPSDQGTDGERCSTGRRNPSDDVGFSVHRVADRVRHAG